MGDVVTCGDTVVTHYFVGPTVSLHSSCIVICYCIWLVLICVECVYVGFGQV